MQVTDDTRDQVPDYEAILQAVEEKVQKVCDNQTDSCSVFVDGNKLIGVDRSYVEDDCDYTDNVVVVVIKEPYTQNEVGANSNVRECFIQGDTSVEDGVKQILPIVIGEMNKHFEDNGLPAVQSDGITGESK